MDRGEMRNTYINFIWKSEGKRPLRELSIAGKLKLKWTSEVGYGMDSASSVMGNCKHNYEHSGF